MPELSDLWGMNVQTTMPGRKTEEDRAADDNRSVHAPQCSTWTVDL